jgi:hypothetical protein
VRAFVRARASRPIAAACGALACVAALVVAACGEDQPPVQPAAPTPAPPSLSRVDLGPANRNIGTPGETLQLAAMAFFDDGSTRDVTGEAAWNVVNPDVVSVSARGLVTAIAYGKSNVLATYRNRSGQTEIFVDLTTGRFHPYTGVVVDGQTGAPVVGAVIPGCYPRTDGNGFFQCSTLAGAMLTIVAFGYAEQQVMTPDWPQQAALRIAMTPNPGAYIERTIDGHWFDEYDGNEGRTTVRISTRAGGLFDAFIDGVCDYNGTFGLRVVSGGVTFAHAGPAGACYARLRFIVPASECLMTISGYKSGDWRLRYREPR